MVSQQEEEEKSHREIVLHHGESDFERDIV